jgi:uncharacterized protein YbcI
MPAVASSACRCRATGGAAGCVKVSGIEEPGLDLAAAAATISEEITTIHTESYETPVKRAVTHILDDLVVAVLDIELSPIERRMIEFGRGNLVHELRHAVQTAEAASFTAVVERATGRRVVGFASHTHIDPPFVAELFRLAAPTAHPVEPE